LYKKLGQHKFKPSRVFVIGNKMENPQIFKLTQVWPVIHHEDIDYVEATKAYPLPHRRFFKKGISKKINNKFATSRVRPNPYEVFNLGEQLLKKKYNVH
ncbi:MAG: hypothetical protein UR21_C0002G0084, partial [Candidatus Woesebacteria bacterium GW2011_GWC2_31_9]